MYKIISWRENSSNTIFLYFFLVMRIESCLFSKIVLTYNSRFYPWNCSQNVTYNGLKTNCKNAFFQNKIMLKFWRMVSRSKNTSYIHSLIHSDRKSNCFISLKMALRVRNQIYILSEISQLLKVYRFVSTSFMKAV